MIRLTSRYKDVTTELDPKTGIITTSSYTRIGFDKDPDDLYFVDFDGGPFLQINDTLNGRKIKSIIPIHNTNNVKIIWYELLFICLCKT